MQKKFEMIRNHIRQDPTSFSDRQRLKNILSDCFQNEPLYMNLLIMAYDENLSGCLKKFPALTTPLLKKFSERLINHHGISSDNAAWAVIAWFKIFNRQINLDNEKLPINPTGQNTPQQKERDRPVQTGISVPTFGSGNVPVQQQSNQPAKNSSTFDLLKRIFKQNFEGVPQWAFWNINNTAEAVFGHAHLTQMPNDPELRQIALNVVCHGKYHANDIIHLRINPQCTFGWALTRDSFCTGGANIGDNIFKYSDINLGTVERWD